jgi:hypothetical protein
MVIRPTTPTKPYHFESFHLGCRIRRAGHSSASKVNSYRNFGFPHRPRPIAHCGRLTKGLQISSPPLLFRLSAANYHTRSRTRSPPLAEEGASHVFQDLRLPRRPTDEHKLAGESDLAQPHAKRSFQDHVRPCKSSNKIVSRTRS